MKVKLIPKILILLVLLSAVTPMKLKKSKRKKKELLTVLSLVFSGVLSIFSKEYRDDSKKKMITNSALLIEKREGIERMFINNMFKICKSAIESSTLNAELLFKYRMRLEKIKEIASEGFKFARPDLYLIAHRFIKSKPEMKEYLESSLKDENSFEQDYKSLLRAAKIPKKLIEKEVKKMEYGTVILISSKAGTYYGSDFLDKYIKLERNLTEITHKDNQIKNDICFGSTNFKQFESLNKKTFEEINKYMEELEDTDNFLELFRSPDERREQWLELAKKYDSEKIDDIEKKIGNNSRGWRIAKGCFRMVAMFIPLVSLGGKVAEGVVGISSALTSADSIGEVIRSSVDWITETTSSEEAGNFSSAIEGILGFVFGPVVSVFRSLKNIIDTRNELAKHVRNTGFSIQMSEIEAFNRINQKSLQVVKSSQNSIFIYRMLKKLSQIESEASKKIISPYYSPAIRRLCEDSLYLCGLEFPHLKNQFQDEHVCAKDIFLAETSENKEIFEDAKFYLFKKNAITTLTLYLNYFFSTSDTIITQVKVGYTHTDAMKNNFINKIKSSKYFNQNKCKGLEDNVFINQLKFEDQYIVLTKVNDNFSRECSVIRSIYCNSASYFFGSSLRSIATQTTDNLAQPSIEHLNLKSFKRSKSFTPQSYNRIDKSQRTPPKKTKKMFNSDLDAKAQIMKKTQLTAIKSNREMPRHVSEDYANANHFKETTKITQNLLGKVCKTSKRPFELISDSERSEIQGIVRKVIRFEIASYYDGEDLHLRGRMDKFFRLIETSSTKLKFNILDALLISEKRVIDPNSVEIYIENQIYYLKLSLFKQIRISPRRLMHFYGANQLECNQNLLIRQNYNESKKILFTNKDTGETARNSDEAYKIGFKAVENMQDLYSRVEPPVYDYIPFLENQVVNLRALLNFDNFSFNPKKKRINIKYHSNFNNCSYSFDFVMFYLKDENGSRHGYSYEFEGTDEYKMPTLRIRKAEGGELSFTNRIFVMVHSTGTTGDEKHEEERLALFKTINRKMSYFGIYGLKDMFGVTHNTSDVYDDGWIWDSVYGEIGFNVFLEPFESEYAKENSSVCDRFNED